MLRSLLRLGVLSAALGSSAVEAAKCVLPVPDGADVTPSPANVEGLISSIQGDVIYSRPLDASQAVAVRVPRDRSIFTAFGGAGDASELRVGQMAWVWFTDCRTSRKSIQQAAYFQIYSSDPHDQP